MNASTSPINFVRCAWSQAAGGAVAWWWSTQSRNGLPSRVPTTAIGAPQIGQEALALLTCPRCHGCGCDAKSRAALTLVSPVTSVLVAATRRVVVVTVSSCGLQPQPQALATSPGVVRASGRPPRRTCAASSREAYGEWLRQPATGLGYHAGDPLQCAKRNRHSHRHPGHRQRPRGRNRPFGRRVRCGGLLAGTVSTPHVATSLGLRLPRLCPPAPRAPASSSRRNAAAVVTIVESTG